MRCADIVSARPIPSASSSTTSEMIVEHSLTGFVTTQQPKNARDFLPGKLSLVGQQKWIAQWPERRAIGILALSTPQSSCERHVGARSRL